MRKKTIRIFFAITIMVFSTILGIFPPALSHDLGWADMGQIGNGTHGDVTFLTVYNSKLYAATDLAEIYRYETNSRQWSYIKKCDVPGKTILQVYNGALYVGCDNGNAYCYTEQTWTYVGFVDFFIMSMTVFQDKLYAGTYTGYVYRYDGGTTWTYVGNPGESALELWVCTLTVYDGSLYAGKVAGPFEGGRVYRYNGNQSWEYCGEPAGPEGYDIKSLNVYNNILFAITRNGVISQYHAGSDWTEVGYIRDQSFYWSSVVKNNLIYVGAINLYSYDGQTLNNLGRPIQGDGAITAMTVFRNSVYVSGNFDYHGHVYRYNLLSP